MDDILHNTVGFLLGCFFIHLFRSINVSRHGGVLVLYRDKIKRALDFMIALIVSPFVILIIIIMSPIIVLNDWGPVFYNAERRGLHRRTFI